MGGGGVGAVEFFPLKTFYSLILIVFSPQYSSIQICLLSIQFSSVVFFDFLGVFLPLSISSLCTPFRLIRLKLIIPLFFQYLSRLYPLN